MDIFESRTITPMLIGENQQAFDSTDYIYELKLDGIRCLAYLWDSGIELQNKRNKILNSIYPELKGIYKQVKARCILDGELVILKDGKPDFFEMQRRSLMTNTVKIELAAKKLPVSFTVFDIVYLGDKQITDIPLTERKELLSKTVKETPSLAISRFIENNGIAFYQLAEDNGLEGIVAKRKESKYYFGKRTKDWIKMKALLDEDFVVCGYYFKEKNLISIILGVYKQNSLVYQSHVVMGVSRHDFKIISSAERANPSRYSDFPEFEDAVWLEPSLVCNVQFMERTPGGGLRQPVFKGLRDDKQAFECRVL